MVNFFRGFVVLCLFTLLFIWMGRWAERLEIEQSTNALQQALEINTLVLRGIIARNDYLPYAIAGHPDIAAVLKKPENKAMVQSVNTNFSKLQEKAASSTVIFLLDHTGTTIASSNWNDPHSFVGENYSQRPYFQNALQGQRSYFYGLGLTTGIPGLFIAEPVRANNRIVGVLVVKVGLETLEAAWVNSVDPVTLQDSRGIVFLSSEQEWMFRSEIKLDEPNIDWLSEHGQYGNRRSYQLLNWNKTPVGERGTFLLTAWIDKKHKKYLAQSSIIPELNWKLTVTTDYQAIESARQEAQVIATLISAVLVLAVLIWRLQEKRRMDHERSQVEREQREKELQLQRSARLASVGEMASTLAHELNQPLMALTNFAMVTRSMIGHAPSDLVNHALNEIVEQAKRASDIVKRIRSIINPKRANYALLNVNAVVEHAISVLRAELDRNIVQLELKLNKHLSDIRGDSVLIEQVIVNLIQNSIQALNDNLNAKKIIVVSTHESDESVFITIADNGPGIPSEKSDEIFNPFFSTKPDGLGLGLNICRTIVEAHRGHISVTTQGILGAIFTINLPVEK